MIGVDLDGKAVARRARSRSRPCALDWEYKKGKYKEKEVDPQTCAVTSRRRIAVPCTFATDEGRHVPGHRDDRRRQGPAEPDEADVLGVRRRRSRRRARSRRSSVQLIPDKKEYAAGDTAELLVQAPFYPAEGARDVAAQRHRQDRAHHADRADGDASRCRSPTRWCRTCTCRSISSAWPRAPTTTAIPIRSCRSGPRTRSARSICRCRRSSARSRSTVAPSAAEARARRARRSSRVEVTRRAGQAGRERRGRGDRRRRGGARAHRLPVPEPDRHVLSAARRRHARLLLAQLREAREARRRRARAGATRPRRPRGRGDGRRPTTGAMATAAPSRRRAADDGAAAADAAEQAKKARARRQTTSPTRSDDADGRSAARTRADRDPLELQSARGVLAGGEDRRRRHARPSTVKMPDNLTRYRIVAIAVAGRASSSARARARSPRGCR